MVLEQFLKKWHGTAGGAERANYALFLTEFCVALGLPAPLPANHDTESRGYQFEAFVRKSTAGEPAGTDRIDLYKPGCFVLEAKQSRLAAKATELLLAAGPEPIPAASKYDALMRDARIQAETYARALPAAEGWPPFLTVCDVGRAFDIYFDWSGMGKDYGPFSGRQSYRIDLLHLRQPAVQELFHAIWTDPRRIDPRLKAPPPPAAPSGASRLPPSRGRNSREGSALVRPVFRFLKSQPRSFETAIPRDFCEL